MRFFALDLSALGPMTVQIFVHAFLTLLFLYVPMIAVMSVLTRKWGADLHARVGPSLSGLSGIAQPVFDFLKFSGQGPPQGLYRRERLALWLLGALFCMALTLLPLSSERIAFDSDFAALIPLLLILACAQILWMLTSAQGSITSLFASLRYTSQVVSAQFAVLIALFTVALEAGGFSFQAIIEAQDWMPHHWNAFRSPFDFVAALVFYSGGLLLTQISKPESSFGVRSVDRDLLSRVHGRGYMFFLIGRYFCVLYWAFFTVILFFGGWRIPKLLQEPLLESGLHGFFQSAEWLVLVGKSFFLLLGTLILWKVNPIPRMDQITQAIWRYLIPLALAALFGKMILFILRATL